MDLETADKIRMDWGKFLEITNGNLMMIFFNKIPQSLLPYPKHKIKEALEVVSKYHTITGNKEVVNAIEFTLSILNLYVDDKEAIESAARNFSNKEYLKSVLPKLGDKQNEQLRYLINKK